MAGYRRLRMIGTALVMALALAVAGPAYASHHRKHHASHAPTASTSAHARSTTKTKTSLFHHKHRTMAHHGRLTGYASLSAARSACHSGGVVWRARGSKVFHGSSSRYFGKTRHGSYICQSAALADHLHMAKN